jgi:periplasmic divalent cation tolerance protein
MIHNIAQHLVTERLTACINIKPNVASVYIQSTERQYNQEIQL